jgi:hypothetical protein
MHKRGILISLMVLVTLAAPLTATSQNLPKPEDVLGFAVGADYHLATYDQAMEYFKQLAAASDRMLLFEAGKTSMGQPMTYAVLSSPGNLAKLDEYKSIARRLSLGAGLSPASAREMASRGRAIVYIDGGLHASECAPAQHNIQLAYDLASAEDSLSLRILDDVILVLVFANPDGMNLLADWYHPNVGTPYEVSSMPRLYHIYAGHDNNRDSYLANLVETQNITRLVNKEWYPVILYNHHQTAPFPARIWTPPNSEPTNPNVHPLVVRWQNMVGSAMGAAFDAEGKEGAISRLIFDTWYPGYVTQVVDSHNIVSILTETALYRYATPHFYTVRDFPDQYQDLTMSAFYPNPWKGGWWRLKDAVEYCLTASKAVLDLASKYRMELLYNKHLMARDVMERFKKEPPHAWIIPEKQMDPASTSLLLNRMILLGIDVYKTSESFTCDGLSYPAGTHIIPMTQAFALFIKNVFETQEYPDLRKYPSLWQGIIQPKEFSGAPLEAYDQMGWTLPLQFGADIRKANTPLTVEMNKVNTVRLQPGAISGSGRACYLLRHEENNSFTATNRILKDGGKVFWAKTGFKAGGESFGAGTVLIPSSGLKTDMGRLTEELDIKITALGRLPDVEKHRVSPVRLGLYQSWTASADEGWTRFVLEQYDFPYKTLHDADIRAGNLKANYDVIILPSSRRPSSIIDGHAKGTMPPKYVGGITTDGLLHLKEFADSGGTLIFLDGSCALAVDNFRIPVKNALSGVARADFVCTGSLLRMEFDTDHPLAYGMPKEGAGIFGSRTAFIKLPSFAKEKEPLSAARYPEENPLLSGWIHGDRLIRQKSTVLDVPYGRGHLILLGFPVQYRGQPYGTFKILFNAVFYAGLS